MKLIPLDFIEEVEIKRKTIRERGVKNLGFGKKLITLNFIEEMEIKRKIIRHKERERRVRVMSVYLCNSI